MENRVVRRRMNVIASHLGAHEDISPTAKHLFPMSCSNSLNSIIWRCDSRMYFARQSSSSQGYFMRQASNVQEICGQSSIPSKSTSCANEVRYDCDAPMFSKPAARQEHKLQNNREIQGLPQVWNYHQHTPDFPTFAKPSRKEYHYHTEQRKQDSKFNGRKWFPRMDVAESGTNYVVTLELPGVSIGNIKVEVNDQNLRVTGNRSTVWQKTANCSINSISAYHKREISEGPYQIVWPLPTNVNKDNISAELITDPSPSTRLQQINLPAISSNKAKNDGLLMITVPKLSTACRQLEKANK